MTAPEPLADPLADLNIPPGTARAYEVKAGQFIQVVDVKGRECTRGTCGRFATFAPRS